MLKSSTSNDSISGQFKFGQIFNFTPTATQIFSANNPPIFDDDSIGMYRRVELIHFPFMFGNVKDMAENSEVIKANPNIVGEVTTEQELSGLFNKAIDHLKNILSEGHLSIVKGFTELKTDYTKYSNSTKAFLESYCEEAEYIPSRLSLGIRLDGEGYLTIREMYGRYSSFCDKNKLIKKTKDGFSKQIKYLDSWNLEFGQQDWKDEDKQRSIRGLRFKETPNTAY